MSTIQTNLPSVVFRPRGAVVADAGDTAQARLAALSGCRPRTDAVRLADTIETITLVLLAGYRRACGVSRFAEPTLLGRLWRAESGLDVRLAALDALDTAALRDLVDTSLYGDDGELGRTARVQARRFLEMLTRDNRALERVRAFCPLLRALPRERDA